MQNDKSSEAGKKQAAPATKPSDKDVKEWTKNTEKSPDDKE